MEIDPEKSSKAAGTHWLGFCLWTNGTNERSLGCASVTFFFLLLIGCGSAALRPVELRPEDMCAFCRMAISQKRFACELMTQDGEALKFDDIGCMLHFRKERSRPEFVAATFVVDFETREWLKFEEAHFVKSKEFATPMEGNLVAFKTKASAEAASVRFQGVQFGQEALLR